MLTVEENGFVASTTNITSEEQVGRASAGDLHRHVRTVPRHRLARADAGDPVRHLLAHLPGEPDRSRCIRRQRSEC